MKKLTQKEIYLTLDMIEISISQITKDEPNDDEYSIYCRLGKCQSQVKKLSNFIRYGYDGWGDRTYREELAIYYEELLSKVGRR